MPTPAQIKAQQEAERRARLRKYQSDIEQMYFDLIDTAAKAAAGVTLKDGIFTLNKYSSLNNVISKELEKLSISVDKYLNAKVKAEWNAADTDNDHLFDKALNRDGKRSKLLNHRNEKAFESFIKRVDSTGLNLSKKVFNYTGTYRQELEVGLGDGIAQGKPAREIAAELKQYLNEPDRLFRRVKKDGVLQLSKPALEHNPGQGVYRSSYKNAKRLVVSETNMSYKKADNIRYLNSPFVIGFTVKLSDSHPKHDICDHLAGDYPKDFIYVGWHPNDLCYEIPILLTPAEYDAMENDLLAGKDVSKIKYTNRALPTGNQAKEWYASNRDRIDNWAITPYFLRDNADFFES